MKKIGICGHFNDNKEAIGGQTIKTRAIYDMLLKNYSEEEINKLDTANWKKNPVIFFIRSIILIVKSKNIIILPAQNGIRILVPLFVILTKVLKKNLHYIIVGAWLYDFLNKNRYLIKYVRRINYIYPQTDTLKNKLSDIGITNNVFVMPNFKEFSPIDLDTVKIPFSLPYKVCLVSRINYKKGIESALKVIDRINKNKNKILIELYIYGPIDSSYKERFFENINRYSDFAKYKGVIDYNNTINVIKGYYLLLFPTQYYTEGFPGTIIDAYFSGVPVLASKWESFSDVIFEGITGLGYEFDNDDDFYKKLSWVVENEEQMLKMKKNCIDEARKYTAENVIKVLTSNFR